jgi:hypothetical protein
VLFLFSLPSWNVGGLPAIFVISSIDHRSELAPYPFNYDSRVTLVHIGTKYYENALLKAIFYRNQKPLRAVISTLDGHEFISTHHYGVQWMGGSGCSGGTWIPGESTVIDFSDGTFLPGDRVQVDIVDIPTNRTISRHQFTA